MAGKQKSSRRNVRSGPYAPLKKAKKVKAPTKSYESSNREECDICKEEFDARGFGKHVEACEKERDRLAMLAAKRRQREHDADATRTPKRGELIFTCTYISSNLLPGRHARQADPESLPSPSPSRSQAAEDQGELFFSCYAFAILCLIHCFLCRYPFSFL